MPLIVPRLQAPPPTEGPPNDGPLLSTWRAMVRKARALDHSSHRNPTPRSDAMNFLNDATLQPRTMRVRAPRHDLSSTPASVSVELALVPMTDAASAEAEDDFSRCGWFDSSLELAAGLQVIEHEDALPDGLPLQPMH
jgi:hypothetical protein